LLHTGITPKIQKSIVIPGKESKAEARVWYVGVTRAIEHLYIVQDEGHNFNLPTIPSASEDFDVWADDSEETVYADW